MAEKALVGLSCKNWFKQTELRGKTVWKLSEQCTWSPEPVNRGWHCAAAGGDLCLGRPQQSSSHASVRSPAEHRRAMAPRSPLKTVFLPENSRCSLMQEPLLYSPVCSQPPAPYLTVSFHTKCSLETWINKWINQSLFPVVHHQVSSALLDTNWKYDPLPPRLFYKNYKFWTYNKFLVLFSGSQMGRYQLFL